MYMGFFSLTKFENLIFPSNNYPKKKYFGIPQPDEKIYQKMPSRELTN